MAWLSRLLRPKGSSDALTLLKLRVTRFRQLLRSYGSLLSLLEDAAEKQGGGFILDRQYVVALAEQVAEIADGVAFDLNILTSQRNVTFYEQVERLRGELRGLLAEGGADTRARPSEAAAPTVPPAMLAAALARFPVIFRERGQVACRGVAAGPVCNLADRPETGTVPKGSVFVASDLDSEDGVLLAVRRAGALLLDRGSAAGPAARRARELRIPAIVGLGDATSRLKSGTEVTVDADENVVYQGRVNELLDYYRSSRLSAEEEPEYRLLRSVRQVAFPLTLPADLTAPTLRDCLTVHDVVYLAHSLASDALGELLSGQRESAGALVPLPGAAWCEVRMINLEGPPSRDGGEAIPLSEVPSRSLREFLQGVSNADGGSEERPGRMPPCALKAAATEEHTLAATTSPGGIDMLDATAGEGRETNTVYCRFAPRGEDDPGAVRGALVAGVLSRLDFTTTLTGHDVTGWIRGLPDAETEERVRILGRLQAHLIRLGVTGWGVVPVEPNVEAFIRGCA